MIINFEFFDEEPIENVISCLHYKFDKVVFFGETTVLEGRKEYTENFLRNHCNVKDIEFIELSASKPHKIIETMKRAIERERKQNNICYFDITGGEGLSLFAFGAVSRELDVPVHMYDIEKDELLEFGKDKEKYLSTNNSAQNIPLDLAKVIEMHGGKINTNMRKAFKQQHTPTDLQHIQSLWNLSRQFSREWNQFANFLSEHAKELHVSIDLNAAYGSISKKSSLSERKIIRMLDACANEKVLHNVSHKNRYLQFSFCNEFVKNCMCDSGSVLEQYTYLLERNTSGNSDCRIGVHIDWDGKFHPGYGNDVLNEIDVMSLYGNVPVFISCKNGKVDQFAMYELQTVTEQFGGKYARQMLVVTKPLSHSHMLRAEEMGIEVKVL